MLSSDEEGRSVSDFDEEGTGRSVINSLGPKFSSQGFLTLYNS